jgi:hypothetical protein
MQAIFGPRTPIAPEQGRIPLLNKASYSSSFLENFSPIGYNAGYEVSILTGDAADLHGRAGGGRCCLYEFARG